MSKVKPKRPAARWAFEGHCVHEMAFAEGSARALRKKGKYRDVQAECGSSRSPGSGMCSPHRHASDQRDRGTAPAQLEAPHRCPRSEITQDADLGGQTQGGSLLQGCVTATIRLWFGPENLTHSFFNQLIPARLHRCDCRTDFDIRNDSHSLRGTIVRIEDADAAN